MNHTVTKEHWATSARSTGIAAVLKSAARRYGDHDAIIADGGTILTYRQLDNLANQVASRLLSLGLQRGDRVAVVCDPSPEYALVNVACAKLGVAAVGINTRLTASEASWCAQDSEAKVLLYEKVHEGLLQDVIGGCPGIVMDLHTSGTVAQPTLADVVDQAGAVRDIDLGQGEDIHTVIYTSGTTGRPKGAMISQSAAAVRALRIAAWFRLNENDAFLGWSPMFHTGGQEPLLATLLSGGRFLTFRKALADRLVRAVDEEKATWGWLLPGNFAEFLEEARRRPEMIASLKFGGGYGNLLPTRLIDELIDLGSCFYDLLGQTEASLLIASNKITKKGHTTWHKEPTPLLELRVTHENGEIVATGEAGELLVRGPSVMTGYMNDLEATSEVFQDGWLHTGDLVTSNDDGTLTFTDRKKYLIKSGGENVYPAEVEAVLSTHPDVAEVCVAGVPDPRWGETVKAFIVRRKGSSTERSEIDAHCRIRLASYKRPKLIEFIAAEEVPRSTTGKIVRSELVLRAVVGEQRV